MREARTAAAGFADSASRRPPDPPHMPRRPGDHLSRTGAAQPRGGVAVAADRRASTASARWRGGHRRDRAASVLEEQVCADTRRRLGEVSRAPPVSVASAPDARRPVRVPALRRRLALVRAARAAVDVPLIASLNGGAAGGWPAYAHALQEAGASGDRAERVRGAGRRPRLGARDRGPPPRAARDVKSVVTSR